MIDIRNWIHNSNQQQTRNLTRIQQVVRSLPFSCRLYYVNISGLTDSGWIWEMFQLILQSNNSNQQRSTKPTRWQQVVRLLPFGCRLHYGNIAGLTESGSVGVMFQSILYNIWLFVLFLEVSQLIVVPFQRSNLSIGCLLTAVSSIVARLLFGCRLYLKNIVQMGWFPEMFQVFLGLTFDFLFCFWIYFLLQISRLIAVLFQRSDKSIGWLLTAVSSNVCCCARILFGCRLYLGNVIHMGWFPEM